MNMKSIVLLMLIFTISAFAHRTLLMVDDNGDGTIYIEAGLSTGGSAAGATVTLTDRATGRPLWQGEIPEAGSIKTNRPEQPYSVTLDMGEGHSITQKGPAFVTTTAEDTTTDSTETTSENNVDSTETTSVSEEDSTDEPHSHSHGDETHTH